MLCVCHVIRGVAVLCFVRLSCPVHCWSPVLCAVCHGHCTVTILCCVFLVVPVALLLSCAVYLLSCSLLFCCLVLCVHVLYTQYVTAAEQRHDAQDAAQDSNSTQEITKTGVLTVAQSSWSGQTGLQPSLVRTYAEMCNLLATVLHSCTSSLSLALHVCMPMYLVCQ